MELTPLSRELLAGPDFAVIATNTSAGASQQSVVWVSERDGAVVFTTGSSRAKCRNLVRDPRIGVLVVDAQNPYRYSQVRGAARIGTEGAAEVMDGLSRKYTGEPWVENQKSPRVTVVVTPERVVDHG